VNGFTARVELASPHRRPTQGRRRLRDIRNTELNVPALPAQVDGKAMKQLDFSRGEFADLTFEQQVSKCRSRAVEANAFAADAREEEAEQYLHFAAKWSGLADEMERFAKECAE